MGAEIRRARIAAGMRQGELAEMLGISIWAMCRFERGSRQFDEAWIDRMPASLRRVALDLLKKQLKEQQAGMVERERRMTA